jgi:hypothetical protein
MKPALTFGAILSVYQKDEPRYLFEALHSLLVTQTSPLDDVVCVVEGDISKDLANVLDHFPLIRVAYIPRQDDAPMGFGLPAALNLALQVISTNVVLKVDTDDINHVHRVRWTREAFESNSSLAIHGGQVQEWDSLFDVWHGERRVPTEHEQILHRGVWRNPFNGPTVAFRREEALAFGGFPSVGANEDYALWGLFLKQGLHATNSLRTYAHMRGGESLVKRRSGLRYKKGERQTLDFLRQHGFLSLVQWTIHVASKGVIRRLPTWGNKYIYSKLRKRGSLPEDRDGINEANEAYEKFQFGG